MVISTRGNFPKPHPLPLSSVYHFPPVDIQSSFTSGIARISDQVPKPNGKGCVQAGLHGYHAGRRACTLTVQAMPLIPSSRHRSDNTTVPL